MKIFLVNHQDPDNIKSWSGIPYFMTRHIREHFDNVQEYVMLESPGLVMDTHNNGMEQTLRPMGTNFSNYLKDNNVSADYIWFIGGSSAIPYYDYDIPTVFWHDSNWHTYLHGYLDEQKFEDFKIRFRNFYLWDKMVLEKTDILIFSSKYIAEACMRNYRIPDRKIKVIPFGANIISAPSVSFLGEALVLRLSSREIHLTFIGIDWERKGLYYAGDLVRRLNEGGIPVRLNIIGADLGADLGEYPYITDWGFLDKSDQDQYALFERILKGTHFLIHPAHAEPFGIALCEANAYGIPVIGTMVEGLMTIVKNGVNGFLFEKETFVEEAMNTIRAIFMDLQNAYPPLSEGAFTEYKERLNWGSGMLSLKNLLVNK